MKKSVYMEHYKILVEPTPKSDGKKKVTKADKKEVHVDREEERDTKVEMIARTTSTKEVNKLVMRCFY